MPASGVPTLLDRFSAEEQRLLRLIGEVGDAMGVPCFLVGGAVRDRIMQRNSGKKDLDFVCEGSGIEWAKRVAERLGETEHGGKGKAARLSVYRNFGTAQVKAPARFAHMELEFVGARKESYNRNSRKPVVEDGSIADDQLRRDFTINAMAIRLNAQGFGELIDPFEGQEDLEAGLIRTPRAADQTFSDDPLRMLRAVRFANQLNFSIEAETLEAIGRQAARLSIISQERITDELNKIIACPVPSTGFRLLEETGLLAQFFPEMVALKGVDRRSGKAHKDNFYHTLQVLDNLCRTSDDLWLRWAAILHDIAKPPTKRFHPQAGWTFHGHEVLGAKWVPKIFRRLKLPMGDPMRFVQKMVLLHLRPISLTKEEVTDSAMRRLLFEAGDDIDALMLLCEADITSKNKRKVKRYLDNFEAVRRKLQEVEEKDRMRNWQPPITGEDIMRHFALKPGPIIGEIKNAIREAILDGEIRNDPKEAWAYMERLGQEKGLSAQ
jgi:putative nucleotidyltransferase with HDIG domain